MPHSAKIVVADDDASLVKAPTVRLEHEGYHVLAATDGYFAVAQAIEHQPDLVILDVHMPAGSGFTVHERLRKVTALASMPVIYITGDKSEQISNAARASSFAVVHKPFEMDQLLGVIEDALAGALAKDGSVFPMTRILIIDNDDGLVRAIEARLESIGYTCATANSGAQGIAIFNEQPPDLVITDLNMPGDGIALATAIRKKSDVPIIVVTGFEDAYDEQLRGITNLTVLQKPFDTTCLIDLVDTGSGARELGRYGPRLTVAPDEAAASNKRR